MNILAPIRWIVGKLTLPKGAIVEPDGDHAITNEIIDNTNDILKVHYVRGTFGVWTMAFMTRCKD